MSRFRPCLTLLLLLFAGLLSLGCGGLRLPPPPGTEATTPRVLKSNDGKSQITLPPGWTVLDNLNKSAELQAGDRKHAAFFVVLTESKEDFVRGTTYEDHARLTLDKLKKKVADPEVVRGPTELVINGRPAVQYELRGSRDHARIVYLHTTVDGKNCFFQLLATTVPSRWQENAKVFEQVIDSFRETGQDGQPPAPADSPVIPRR